VQKNFVPTILEDNNDVGFSFGSSRCGGAWGVGVALLDSDQKLAIKGRINGVFMRA
jgi:hypothetical protein